MIVRANGIDLHVELLDPSPPGSDVGRAPAPAADDTRARAPSAAGTPGPPTAVLIHGMASDTLASWYFTLAKPLADAGFRVVMYDLRGHGHSERPPTGYAIDDFVDDLAALLDELGVTGPVYLFGNSFGGTIAFGYAIRHPERAAAIVAIESAPPTPAWMARVARGLARAAELLPRQDAVAALAAGRREGFGRRARATREMLAATTLAEELPASPLPDPSRISAIGVPVLCVYGAESAVAQLAPEVARLLPQTRTVVVAGARHSVLVDRSETVRGIVLAWLREECGVAPAGPVPTHPDHIPQEVPGWTPPSPAARSSSATAGAAPRSSPT